MKSLTVLIPTLNEEKAIGSVIKKIPVHNLSSYNVRVVVADGRSTDRTVEIAKACGAEIIFERRKGKGIAVKTALEHIDSDYVVMLDGDMTYDPADIPELINCLSHCDAACGYRNASKSSMRSSHMLGNKILTATANLLYKQKTRDLCTGYWSFTKRAYKNMIISAAGFELEANIFAEISRLGLRLDGIDINYSKRAGEAKLRAKDGLRILLFLLKSRLANRR